MRPFAFVTLLLLVANALAREPRFLSAEQMIGRVLVLHAHEVGELAPAGRKEDDETYLDDLMRQFKPSYQRLAYGERREFGFYTIAHARLDAGFAIAFIELIKADAPRIERDLSAIPDDTLRRHFCMSDTAVKDFRNFMHILRGVDAKWQP
jgi:hypothetical protein